MEPRVVRVRGDSRARGRVIGEALAEPIHSSIALLGRYLGNRGRSPDDLPGLLTPYRDAAAASFPSLIAEIDGMAEGAEAPWWELFALNSFEELEPLVARKEGPVHSDRCTAFAVITDGGTLVGHNEQWFAGEAGNIAIIAAQPEDGTPFVSPTVASMLPAVGMNAEGVAQSIMSLTASDDGVGVPRVFVSRSSLEANDPDDAIRRATVRDRAGGYAHLFGFRGGAAFVLETSASRHDVLMSPGGHTNHYLGSIQKDVAAKPSAGSVSRFDRLTELLDPGIGSAEEAKAVLADHRSQPQAICLHPSGEDDPEAPAVVFSMLCDVDAGRMWVALGHPCTSPFQEFQLAELFN